jgi:hypothetical protein
MKKDMSELKLLKSPESLKCGEVLAIMRDTYKMVDLDGFPEEENNLLEVWLGPKLNQSIALQIMSSLCDEYATSFCKYSTVLLIDVSGSIIFSTVLHAQITVPWSRPPNSPPISGSDWGVMTRHRYIATCRESNICRTSFAYHVG